MRTCLTALVLAVATAGNALGAVTLTHVHGLAYSPDGKRLMVPSHHGLAVYENGKWSKGPGPQHDYMGFAATAKNLYSSGHPAHGSGLVNPFGLIRSRDGGKTWDRLGLEGETDFHLLATGWNTNAIYVWSPEPSSRMRRPGLHFTLNQGFAWRRASATGLVGEPHTLAVHPDDSATVAIATTNGLFISRDSGERFSALVQGSQTLSARFDLDGKHLWFGSFDGAAALGRVRLETRAIETYKLPPLGRDAVAYLAQNPAARTEYAIATFERSIYLTKDGGRTWLPIANRGKGQ